MQDHGLLKIQDDEGREVVIYSCPLVGENDDERAQSQILQGYLRYRPDAIKLAAQFNHNLETVMEALHRFETNGDGGHLTRQGLESFRKDAERSCLDKHQRTSGIPKIFCDLDGVLVDFEKGVQQLFGKPIKNIPNKQLWSTAARIPGFYSNLPWMEQGRQLWDQLKHLAPTILTAAPIGSWAEGQKRCWVDRELGKEVPMIVSTKKFEHCPSGYPPAILIDDRLIHCEAWETVGGIAILHRDTNETLEKLREILNRMGVVTLQS